MPFLLAEILNFQGSTHRIGVGSFSYLYIKHQILEVNYYGSFRTGQNIMCQTRYKCI